MAERRPLVLVSGVTQELPSGDTVAGCQPSDSDLTALAGLSTTGLIERTGSGTAGIVTVTTAGKAILDDATAADQRTTLGLGTAATTASTDYAPAAQGVTNCNSHNHDGGDGAQIAYSSLSGLPSVGKILQVVAADYTPSINQNTDVWTDVGLSASITPSSSSSKILVLATIPSFVYATTDGASSACTTRLKRGSTVLVERNNPYLKLFDATGIVNNVHTFIYLDSPATTSATTYSFAVNIYNATSTIYVDQPCSVVLLEVAA